MGWQNKYQLLGEGGGKIINGDGKCKRWHIGGSSWMAWSEGHQRLVTVLRSPDELGDLLQ